MNSTVSYETFQGISIQDTVQIPADQARFGLPGEHGMIPVSESLLSKHVLLLGAIGSGKTNVFNHFIRNIRGSMNSNDIMIIFDPKGDYYEKFYRDGDIVISNDSRCNAYWNIFNEVRTDSHIEENVYEISNFLFKDKIKKSSNPFFPSAAKDIFAALMLYVIRNKFEKGMNNLALRRNIDYKTEQDFREFFSHFTDLKGINSYIGEDAKGQTQGVMSEFRQTAREVFIGNFNQIGDFSIRQAVKNKGNKVIFIEYDLSVGKTLAPVYSLLLDLAIKEALCRKEDEGNVYFVLDEFRLMSALDHMDNGINFGRSLGAKFILGLQNVEQIYDVYGEYAGRSILSGCSTLISFFVVDQASRDLIKGRSGNNLRKIPYMSVVQSRGIMEQVVNGSAIEDWEISRLPIGGAIVQYLNYPPFFFQFKLFR